MCAGFLKHYHQEMAEESWYLSSKDHSLNVSRSNTYNFIALFSAKMPLHLQKSIQMQVS
jgi:hypothetical protein